MKLVVRAPLVGINGYAQLSRQIVLGLAKHPDVELVSLQPLLWEYDSAVPDSFKEMERLVNQPVNLAECTLLQISLPIEFNDNIKHPYPIRGWKRRVGYTMLETDRISLPWMIACNSMDGMIVPAAFNKTSFERSGVTVPIAVVNPSISEPSNRITGSKALAKFRYTDDGARRFLFYAAGQWSPPQGQSRKGFEELLESYFHTFTEGHSVGLVLRTTCTGGGSINDQELVLSKIERCAVGVPIDKRPPILLLHGRLSDEECDSIWGYIDAFVLPSHGEGWGLDFVVAATREVPIVTLPGSGTEDFLRGSEGVEWLKSHPESVCPEIAFYSRGAMYADHQWQVADAGEISRGLLAVRGNYDKYKQGAKAWRPKMMERFKEATSTNNLVAFLRQIDTPAVSLGSHDHLVVQPISLGDVFMISAIVDGLKNKGVEAVDVMTKKSCQTVWEGNLNVRAVLDYPDPFTIPLWREHFDRLPKAAELRQQYEAIHTPYHQTQIDFSQVPKWFEEKKHIVEVYAEACGLTPSEIGKPFIKVKQPTEIVLKREYFGKKWVVIHPWTGAANKRWGGFDELVERIHKLGRAVIQVGGPKDPVTVGVDKFIGDLHEAAWILNPERAAAFVGVDSIMGHVAGSLGVPTFSIFGGTTESFSFPYWGHSTLFAPKERACGRTVGCHADICQVLNPCIETLSSTVVMAALEKIL